MASTSAAQQRITLTEATERALQRNLDIRIEREAINAAAARELRAQGSYDLHIGQILAARQYWKECTFYLFVCIAPITAVGQSLFGR